MRIELNEMNVGVDLHRYGCVLDEIKAANEYFLPKLENLSGKSNGNYDREVLLKMIILFLIMLLTNRKNYILMAVAMVVSLPPLLMKRKW